eukprot:Anaeramoba_ignava/a348732_159.p1 GENE.a348732_159~~a348732_159.p1  ORF type:complete len:724 (+),score=233.74 a348732_159:27-2198(+)
MNKEVNEKIRLPEDITGQILKGDAQIKMPNKALFEIINEIEERKNGGITLKKANYEGISNKKAAKFSSQFEIEVLSQNQWSKLELLPTTVALTGHTITNSVGKTAWIASRGSRFIFLANQKGLYKVNMEFSVKYETSQEKSISFRIPQSQTSNVQFSVSGNVDIYAQSSINSDLVRQEKQTLLKTSLISSCSYLKINWSELKVENLRDRENKLDEDKEKEKEKAKFIVNSEQFLFFTIGEGVVITDATFRYQILNGNRGKFEIEIPNDVKIVSVTGANIIKWKKLGKKESRRKKKEELLDLEKDEKEEKNLKGEKFENSEKLTGNYLLRVTLQFPVEGSFYLSVVAESPISTSSGKVCLPAFVSREVNREKGWIGVDGLPNYEINEIEMNSITKIDVKELPTELKQKSPQQIMLFAYKFLVPEYGVKFDVHQHNETDVLVAVIDEMHIKVSYSGSIFIYQCSLNMRNTQKQFLRIKIIDPKFQLWSTCVSGSPVKPSFDNQDKCIMVPLEKQTENSDSFLLDFVYISLTPQMKSRGNFQINFPLMDLPINQLFITLYLPKNYKYSEFSGSIPEVTNFSSISSSILRPTPITTTTSTITARNAPQLFGKKMPQSNIKMNFFMNDEENEDFEIAQEQFFGTTKGASNLGVMPVQISEVVSGLSFFFEKFLIPVTENNEVLKVSYLATSKGFFEKRRVSKFPIVSAIFGIISLVVFYLWFLITGFF